MDINAISDATTTFGFPIVMVGACAWLIWYFVKTATTREEKLYTELAENRIINNSFVEAIQGMKSSMDSMNVKIDKVQEDVQIIKEKIDDN